MRHLYPTEAEWRIIKRVCLRKLRPVDRWGVELLAHQLAYALGGKQRLSHELMESIMDNVRFED